jgi:hypothetical protein
VDDGVKPLAACAVGAVRRANASAARSMTLTRRPATAPAFTTSKRPNTHRRNGDLRHRLDQARRSEVTFWANHSFHALGVERVKDEPIQEAMLAVFAAGR